MNPLQTRLAALRHRLRFVVTVRGASCAAALLLGGLFLTGLFDALLYTIRGVETWSLLRAGLLAGTLAATSTAAYLLLFRPLAGRTDDLSLALRVEEQYPVLNDALASTVQFLENAETRPGTSPGLQQEAVQRALRLAQGCDFKKAVNASGFNTSILALMIVLAAFVLTMLAWPAAARKWDWPTVSWTTALARATDPFGDHSWIGKTEIDVRFPPHLAIGLPLSIGGDVHGTVPAKAEIEFDDASMPARQADIKKTADGKGTFFASGIKLPTYRSEIRFRVRAGNGASPKQNGNWHTVALRRPPQLASLNGKPSPQIVIRQPRYAELPEFIKLPEGSGNLDVVAGAHVTLRAATDVPIARAWIDYKPLQPGAKDALLLAALGPRHPVDALVTNALASSVWGPTAGVVARNGTEFSVVFAPALTGAYVLTIQDKDGLSRSYEFDLNVKPDPVPTVSLLRPAASQSVLANAEITLQVLAVDDSYGLRTVFLEYRRKDKHGRWVDVEPKRLFFYDHAKTEIGLPLALNLFGGGLLPLPTQLLHLEPKRLNVTQRWSLRGLAIEGETLVIQACAEDYNNIVAFPQIGKSHEIELKIVGKTALSSVFDEREIEIQQQLLKLKIMQERALKLVIGAEQQWKATGKLRPEDLVDLAEAEQLQKEIQARVGTKKDEGLRADLGQLEEMLKDNKLPKSEITERVRTIREELERLSRENLPKIEPDLNKARRELEAPEQPMPPDPKEPGDLGNARAEQEKVQQTVEELLKFMEERATFQQLKGELRAILQEQQERQKEVDNLRGEVTKHGEGVLRTNELKAELRRTAELQRRLADRAEKLIERLEQHGQKVADTDPALAEMLERAAKIGKEEFVSKEMQDIAGLLQDNFDRPKQPPSGKKSLKAKAEAGGPNIPLAFRSQAVVIDHLEKMLEVLDRSRADEVERIVVNQKKEEKRLSALAEKIADLQENIEAARKIADPQQRADQLKKLAEELKALHQQAEQSARELAHAEAKEAANDLKDAAKKMERILRQLERGEDPQENLDQAQEKIGGAMDKLKDAREIAEEELSREQIAKILDRLRGLKDRQDAALGEAQRLRKDFLQNSRWTSPKVQSLIELKGTQEGVAGETAFLKDKLKGAMVYHAILDRAHQDMLAASKKVESWQVKANQHMAPNTLTDKEFAEEKLLFEATAKLQKSSSDRLQRLIDALQPELEPPRQDPKQGGPGDPKQPAGNEEKKGGIQAQDGIPSTAQLKALKAEQLDVNARTKEFAEQHPNVNKLTPAERGELDAIHLEQDRLLQLFRELVASAKTEKDTQ